MSLCNALGLIENLLSFLLAPVLLVAEPCVEVADFGDALVIGGLASHVWLRVAFGYFPPGLNEMGMSGMVMCAMCGGKG